MNELPDNLKKACLIIANPPIRNRIKNEILKLINSGYCNSENIYIENDLYNINNQHMYCVIHIQCNINKKYYKFNITNSYPFSPPNVEIQLKPYIYYLQFNSEYFKKLFYKNKGRNMCFCCYTKTCHINWSPSVTLLDLIKETIEYANLCREISHIVLVNIIKRKYLIDDIDIISWLY